MQFAIQQVIKLFVDNKMPRETQWNSGADVDSPVLPSASVCMWWLVCTTPFQVLLVFSSPSVLHGVTLSFSLSLSLSQTERREKGVWTSRSWNTEFFVCLLHMVSFKHAEHIIPLCIFIFKIGVFEDQCALCSLSRSNFYTGQGNRTNAAYACTKTANMCLFLIARSYKK